VPNRQDEFERVALPHTRGLLRFARRLTVDSTVAEDLVQEALLRAWRSFDQFQPGTNARAWLFRIVVNSWYGWSRKTKPIFVTSATRTGTTQEALEVNQAVDRLPAEQRTAIMLAVVEGFTCKEIAGILDVPTGTVMSRLSRARQALREQLGERQVAATVGGGKQAR
jgi:RNA polymerase sigma-70 factor (ECF subfamily)